MSRKVTSDLWWKDAVIYCLDVETFFDTDGDGRGDLRGVCQRIDHLAELDRLERVGALIRGQRRRGAALCVGRHPVGRNEWGRRHQPACSSSRTIWLMTLPSARPLNFGIT